MQLLHQSAFLHALGAALIGSLWQMAVLWILYSLITARLTSAAIKYRLALLSLSAGSIWFFISLLNLLSRPEHLLYPAQILLGLDIISRFNALDAALPWISTAYLAFVGLLLLRLFSQYRQTKNLAAAGIQKPPVEIRLFIQKFQRRFGIQREIRIWLSQRVNTPLTMGFWKPIILLPVAAVNQLEIPQLEAILLHELNHIRRNDYLTNLLMSFVEIVLFFNPFARIFSGIIRREREHLCDDKVLEFNYNAGEYAVALLALEKQRQLHNPLLMAATGKNKPVLLLRIRRIITGEDSRSSLHPGLMVFLLSVGLLAMLSWFGRVDAYQNTQSSLFNISTQYYTINQYKTPDRILPVEKIPERQSMAGILVNPANEEKLQTPTLQTSNDRQEPATIYNRPGKEIPEQLELVETTNEFEEQTAYFFVREEKKPEFTLSPKTRSLPPVAGQFPFVPSSSFSFQLIDDTTMPKKPAAVHEKIAREYLENALHLLDQINWVDINERMARATELAELQKIEAELRMDLDRLDAKKDSLEYSLARAFQESFLTNDKIKRKIADFQQERLQAHQNAQRLRELIIFERLHQQAPPSPAKKPGRILTL